MKNEEQKKRIATQHQQLVQSIFEKIPDLTEENEVYINKGAFKLLTDQEFIVLWSLPNIVIRVSRNAADYLEERRLLLGLEREGHSGVLKSDEQKN